MTRLNSLHPSLGETKKPKKTKKQPCHRHSGPVGLLGFLVFFGLPTFDLLEVLLTLSQIFPMT
jgi:hypothetical protein